MDAKVEAALVAGIVSLITAVIGFILTRAKIHAELRALKLQQKHSLLEKLYELRLDAYPEVFSITQEVAKPSEQTGDETKFIMQAAAEKLESWHSSKSGLLLSRASLRAYYDLLEVLRKQPANASGYTNDQLRKIRERRNNFRWALREDIALLHDE